MTFPLVRDLAADETFPVPVAVTCRVLGFSRQAFSLVTGPGPRARSAKGISPIVHVACLTDAGIDVHADDPEFGYRFVADELDQAGHPDSCRLGTAGLAAVLTSRSVLHAQP